MYKFNQGLAFSAEKSDGEKNLSLIELRSPKTLLAMFSTTILRSKNVVPSSPQWLHIKHKRHTDWYV